MKDNHKAYLCGLIIGMCIGFVIGSISPSLLIKSAYPQDGLPKAVAAPFVRAIITSESTFNPRARSPVGARGLMQLMPATANMVHRSLFGTYVTKERLYDPYISVALGTTYLLEMIYEFKDDGCSESLDLALASYNGGPGAVRRGFRATKYVNKIHRLAKPL